MKAPEIPAKAERKRTRAGAAERKNPVPGNKLDTRDGLDREKAIHDIGSGCLT